VKSHYGLHDAKSSLPQQQQQQPFKNKFFLGFGHSSMYEKTRLAGRVHSYCCSLVFVFHLLRRQ